LIYHHSGRNKKLYPAAVGFGFLIADVPETGNERRDGNRRGDDVPGDIGVIVLYSTRETGLKRWQITAYVIIG